MTSKTVEFTTTLWNRPVLVRLDHVTGCEASLVRLRENTSVAISIGEAEVTR